MATLKLPHILIYVDDGLVASSSEVKCLDTISLLDGYFKTKIVDDSSCEVVKEVKWLVKLLKELNVEHKLPVVFVDNQSAIRQIHNTETLRRSKHIDIKYYFIKEAYENNEFRVEHISTDQQPADYLTKLLHSPKLKDLIPLSGMIESKKNNAKVVALCAILLLANISGGASIKFEKAQTVIWMPTNNYIDEGIDY